MGARARAGRRVTGAAMMAGAVAAAVVLSLGLYRWDAAARATEAALRPAPVAPLAPSLPSPTVPASPAVSAATKPAGAPAPAGGDVAAGEKVFAAQCNSCHPKANAGIGPALHGPQFAERYPDDGPLAAAIRQGKGGMPGFAPDVLTDQDLAPLIAYLRSLDAAGGGPAAGPAPTPSPTALPAPRERRG